MSVFVVHGSRVLISSNLSSEKNTNQSLIPEEQTLLLKDVDLSVDEAEIVEIQATDPLFREMMSLRENSPEILELDPDETIDHDVPINCKWYSLLYTLQFKLLKIQI